METVDYNNTEPQSLKEYERQMENSSITNNAKFALTTVDNPYNPFSDFSNWLMYDNLMGYGTCSYLARIAFTSNQLTENENNLEIERAIDEIIENDFLKIYKKVENKFYKSQTK